MSVQFICDGISSSFTFLDENATEPVVISGELYKLQFPYNVILLNLSSIDDDIFVSSSTFVPPPLFSVYQPSNVYPIILYGLLLQSGIGSSTTPPVP